MKRAVQSLAAALMLYLVACASAPPAAVSTRPAPLDVSRHRWSKLETEPYRGKQDDIYFVTPDLGWYVNGSGKIFKTVDGGATWVMKLHKPGTYFRCIAFIDAQRGFAGNIGPDYFPNVTDATPLYETRDGGESWTAVTSIRGPMPVGLCSINVQRQPFINAGVLDYRITVYAGGRVGGPAYLLKSSDRGETWESIDMSAHCAMILDVQFLDDKTGIISAASSAKVEESNALILRTEDGGRNWKPVYRSTRPYEITWKSSFPTPSTGFVTVQSYDPDKSVTSRVVAHTSDGGRSWQELPLVDDFAVREFGVGFVDEKTGWVGTTTGGFETRDGGLSWSRVEMGKAVNKIRIVRDGEELVAYAIGTEVHKFAEADRASTTGSAAAAEP